MKLTTHDIEDFYSQYVSFDDATRVTRKDGSEELTTRCPFHKDESPSLSINLTKGLYKCHASSCPQSGGGNIYQFYAAVNDVDVSVARDKIFQMYKRTDKKVKDFPVTEEMIQAWHVALINNETMMKWMRQHCRWTDHTIEEFELGWNGKEVTIPIRRDGQLLNVRRYTPNAKQNKVQGVSGFNTARLWPVEKLDEPTVYLFEGEKDCMLANQLGLPSATVTSGAGVFHDEWRKYFMGKNVVICYDIDKTGQDGADKVINVLSGCVASIKKIKLPLSYPDNGDFTDYILQKNTVQDFYTLVDQTPTLKIKDETYVEVKDDIEDATLESASYEDKFFKRLRIKVRILGKDLAPFIIPKEITVSCSDGRKTKCIGCGLQRNNLSVKMQLNEIRPELLAFLNCSTAQQKVVLRQTVKIAGQCHAFNVSYTSHQFVEEITAIPYIDEQTFDGEYIRRTMYVLNHKLEANRDYEVEALTVPDPRSQYLVHIIYKSRPCETSIEEFEMNDELFEKLRVFQCQPNELENNLDTSTTTSPQT